MHISLIMHHYWLQFLAPPGYIMWVMIFSNYVTIKSQVEAMHC